MSAARLQRLADTVQARLQDGHLVVNDQSVDLPELTRLLDLFPNRQLGLSGVVIQLQESTLTIGGRWDGTLPIPGTPSLVLQDVDFQIVFHVKAFFTPMQVSLTAQSAPPLVIVADRLSIQDSSLNLKVSFDENQKPSASGELQGSIRIGTRTYQAKLAVGNFSSLSADILPAPEDGPFGLAELGSLIGISNEIAPLDTTLTELGLSGVQLQKMSLSLDVNDPASLSAEVALDIVLRDITLWAVLRYPGFWMSAGLSSDTPLKLKDLVAKFGVAAPNDLPDLEISLFSVEVFPDRKELLLNAALTGDCPITIGTTSIGLTGAFTQLQVTPSGVVARLRGTGNVAEAECDASITLPAFELAAGLVPGSSISLKQLTNALLPADVQLPTDAPEVVLSDLVLKAQPLHQTFSLTAATSDMWTLPFGKDLSVGKLTLEMGVVNESEQLHASAKVAGTFALGGAELTSQLILQKDASSITISQGTAPLELTALVAGFLPEQVGFPTEIGGLDRLAIEGLAGSFDFASKAYLFKGKSTLQGFKLGALDVTQAEGEVEVAGTGGMLETLKVKLSASLGRDLVPGLNLDSFAFQLTLDRTSGTWQWNVGGELVASLLELPKQTLRADASNGQFTFSLKSTPALEWALPAADASFDVLKMRFEELSLSLVRNAERNATDWTFAGTGGLQIADLPALSGTLSLFSTAEQAGFIFTAKDGKLSFPLNLAPDEPRMKLGCTAGAESLSLIKKVEETNATPTSAWTLSSTSFLEVNVEPYDADSTDPTDRTLKFLGSMFEEKMTMTLTVAKSGVSLVVDHLPKVPEVPVPVLKDGHVNWEEYKGKVGLSQLTLQLGKKIAASCQLSLQFPPEINNIFGVENGKPKVQLLNLEWLFGLAYDETTGLLLRIDTLPINLTNSGCFKDEVEGDRTWTRFSLWDISFRFGSFADPENTFEKWIHLDFDAFGEIRFQQPNFSFNGVDFFAKGNFHILRELRLPTAPIRWILQQCGAKDFANLLPDGIAPLKLEVLNPGGKTFDADKFVNEIDAWATTMKVTLPGSDEYTDFRPVARALAGQFNQLPEDLRSFFNVSLPDRLDFDIAVTPATGLGVKFDIKATKESPLRLLVPGTDLFFVSSGMPVPALYGLTIRKLSFGEIISGSLLLAGADMDIDYFDLVSLGASVALPESVSGKFTSTPSIQKKLILGNVLCLVVYETAVPIPIPIWFDSFGVKYFGIEALRSQLVINNNLAEISLGKIVKGLAKLYKEVRQFFTDTVHALPKDLFSSNGLNVGVNVEPGFIQLPKYLGGGLLGSESKLFGLGLDELLVPLLNYFKNLDLDSLLAIIPLEHRNDAFGTNANLQIGPFQPQAAWLVSTTKEFDGLVSAPGNQPNKFVTALYSQGSQRGNMLAEALRSIGKDASSGAAHDGVIVYAQGNVALASVESSLDVFAGFMGERQRGVLTQFQIKGNAGSLVALDVGGHFAAGLSKANDLSSFDVMLGGHVRLDVFERRVLDGEMQLENGNFRFSGAISLFPPESSFEAKANITGLLSAQHIEIAGETTLLALPPLPAAKGNVFLSADQCRISLSWLNQTWSLDVAKDQADSYLLSARADKPVDLLPGLVRVLDATNDAAGPWLELRGPASPLLVLSGRVGIEKFSALSSGFVKIDTTSVTVNSITTFLGSQANLEIRGKSLDAPASLEFNAVFEGDLRQTLTNALKTSFEKFKSEAQASLDAAYKIFMEEWDKFMKLVEEGANAIRAALLEAKRIVEAILTNLEDLIGGILELIQQTKASISARKQELQEIRDRLKAGLKWFEDRVADAERNLANKQEEMRRHDDWYWSLNDNDRFWRWGDYSIKKARLWVECEALPLILRTVRGELAKAQVGVDQGADIFDQILQQLERLLQGYEQQLQGYRQQIINRKKELDEYNRLLSLKSEELLEQWGQKIDSSVKDAAEESFKLAKKIMQGFTDAIQFMIGNLANGIPFSIERLEVNGLLSAHQGKKFQARADVKVNIIAQAKVAQKLGFELDFDNIPASAVSFAKYLLDHRDSLGYVDLVEYERIRAQADEVLRQRAILGPQFGVRAEKQLLHDQPWDELAEFYRYARENVSRFPRLKSAIAVMERFHRILDGYFTMAAAPILFAPINVAQIKRRVLIEVQRRYKAEFARLLNEGAAPDDVVITEPEEPVSIFSEYAFEGNTQRLVPGRYDVQDLTIGNDTLKSLWVTPGYRVVLYEHAGFQGERYETDNIQVLYGTWANRVSSILVECIDLAAPNLEAWARNLPVAGSPVWKSGAAVRYAVAYEYEDGSIYRSGWWSPMSGGVSADAYGYLPINEYGAPMLTRIGCDPTNRAVARRIYRQFRGLPERMVHRIPNNTDTKWIDDDLGIGDVPVAAPALHAWARNLPVKRSPVWRDNYRVRYAIAYEFADGRLHRSGWWSPTTGGSAADAYGYITSAYACAMLEAIACDPTNQAVARRIYRQFIGRPERMVHRIPNNSDTTWTDEDLGIAEEEIAPPKLKAWANNLPVEGSPVWQPDFEVRYAVAYEFADGSIHRSDWWAAAGGGRCSDVEGYLSSAYGCPILRAISCDPTGQAVARRIYRQFRGRPERMIHRIDNNTDTEWIDRDLGVDEPSPATLSRGANVGVIGTDQAIYAWDGANWERVEGAATAIAMGPGGQAFVINEAREIYRRDGSIFTKLPGAALDIGVGANGSVFIVGTDNKVYRWNGAGWDAQNTDVQAMRIAVSPNGQAFFIATDDSIYRDDQGLATKLPGLALDIGVGSNGSVYVIGTDNNVYRWSGLNWVAERASVKCSRIAVGTQDEVLVVDVDRGIHRLHGGLWQKLPGAASDIGACGDRHTLVRSSLRAGHSLKPGESLTSPDERFTLMYQADGNLVLYQQNVAARWNTETHGTAAGSACMQLDGSLVVYDARGRVTWTSAGSGGKYGEQHRGSSLEVQNDGNLVVYAADRSVLWASGTSGP